LSTYARYLEEKPLMPRLALVPLDGSPLAEQALPFAAALARQPNARVLLLRVLEPGPDPSVPLIHEAAARAELEYVAEHLRLDGLDVETLLFSTLHGNVASVIVETAGQRDANLIVMSSHGRGGPGRWVHGSVAEEVLRTSPIPVLVIPATCSREWVAGRDLRILVPLDGSTLAEQALEPILASLAGIDVELVLLRVVPAPSAEAAAYLFEDPAAELAQARAGLEAVADRLRRRDLQVSVQTSVGSAAEAITRMAHEQAIDLIAMATHGRSGLARVVLGSVATETLRRASVPLLLYRPTSLAPDGKRRLS
jgi:nucleotide-binding universal stress UspA family protein